MNEAVTRYRREVCRCLRCGRAARRRLEGKLTGLLNAFLEENSAPDRAALEAAFGAPEELAATLMEELTPEERSQWKRQRLAARVVCVALVILLAVFSVYTFFYKSKPHQITVEDTVYIYVNGESEDSSTLADSSASVDGP